MANAEQDYSFGALNVLFILVAIAIDSGSKGRECSTRGKLIKPLMSFCHAMD